MRKDEEEDREEDESLTWLLEELRELPRWLKRRQSAYSLAQLKKYWLNLEIFTGWANERLHLQGTV